MLTNNKIQRAEISIVLLGTKKSLENIKHGIEEEIKRANENFDDIQADYIVELSEEKPLLPIKKKEEKKD